MALRTLLPVLFLLPAMAASAIVVVPDAERPFCQSEASTEAEEDEEPDCD